MGSDLLWINSMKKGIIFTSSLLSMLIGILLALNIDAIRFTHYIEPTRVEVSPAQAYKEIIARWSWKYLFLDVRTLSEYNQLHASWSQSTPIADLYSLWEHDLPRSSEVPIYLICTSGRLASVAYDFLQLHGFRNIRHIEGGVTWWVSADQPIQARQVFHK